MRFGVMLAVLLAAEAASAESIQGQLDSDTTWTPAGSPYTLTGDVTIPPGVTLTIEPGVVVIAAETDEQRRGIDPSRVELIARGTLRVLGTDASRVTFQGTPLNGTGVWQGVRVEQGGTALLSHVLIQNANSSLEVVGTGTSATLSSSTLHHSHTGVSVGSGGTLAMAHTLLHGLNGFGVIFNNGNGSLHHNTIVNCYLGGVEVDNESVDHHVTIRDSIITSSGVGISRPSGYAGTVELSHNDVWDNYSGNYSGVTEGPQSFSANPLLVSTSFPTTNFHPTANSPVRHAASDGISDLGALPFTGDPTPFIAGTLHEDTTLTGNQYLDGDITVPPGVTVTVDPGFRLLAAGKDVMKGGADPAQVEFIVRGTLRVLGTGPNSVSFQGSYTGPGKWRGVRVEEGGTALLSHLLISDATQGLEVVGTGSSATLSSGTLTRNTRGALVRDGGSLAMDRTLVHANDSDGVSFNDGNGTLRSNTLSFNGGNGVGVYNASSGKGVTVSTSIITHNSLGGILRPEGHMGLVELSHNDVWNNANGDYSGVIEGPNSISADPLFQSTSYLYLRDTSPCRGAGPGGTDLGALPYAEFSVARVELYPPSTTLGINKGIYFIARAYNATGTPIKGVFFSWSAKPSAGTISAQGAFTASCTVGTHSAAVTATSPNGVSTSADITIEPGPATLISLLPSYATIGAGTTRLFTAKVQDRCGNLRADSVTWSTASGAGSITPDGQYTAPCKTGSYGGAIIASVGSLVAKAGVSVTAGPLAQLSLSPQNPSVAVGGQLSFSLVATDSCGNVTSVSRTWSLVNGGGTLGSSGVFTAGTTAGVYADTIQVSAGGKVARTSVTVTDSPIASLKPTASPVPSESKEEGGTTRVRGPRQRPLQ